MEQSRQPEQVDIADAEGHLDSLVESVSAGGSVCLTRNGVPVALLTAIEPPRKPTWREGVDALTAGMPFQTEGAGEFMRRLRDEDRY
jgi:prevent-host-death family protein